MTVPLTLSSVPAQTPYVQYVSGSSQTVFPYPFEITQDSDLVCLINGVAQPTDGGYTLSGQGATGGGNLTFTLGQTAGTIITLYRNISIQRITQLSQNGTFFSANFNNEFNKIYLIMQQLQQSLLPGGVTSFALTVPNSNNPAPTTLLTPAAYANKYLSFDANGNPQPAALTSSGAITTSLLAPFLNLAASPAENSIGVVPTNLQYPVGNVDRYGTNTTPGTTSMAGAFQKAINVAKACGIEVTYGDTAPYLIDAALDCTTAVGATNYTISIRGKAHNAAFSTNAPYRPPLILKHTGHAFDTTGNTGINFQNMAITCDASTFPKTCFLLARNTEGRSQIARFDNVRVYGAFSDSLIYNYGSEDDVHVGCLYVNSSTAGASKTIRHTSNNVSGFTSTFTTIATGQQSTIDHTYMGCQLENLSTNAAADLIYYDGCADVRFLSCWAYMAGGRAMHYHDGTNAVSQSVSFRDWVTESISAQQYFTDYSNNTGTISGWHFDNVVSYSSSNFIHTEGATPVLDEFWVNQILDVNNHGINIAGTLQNSILYFFQPITIGTSSGNILTGNAPAWTITTRSSDKWNDWASSTTWTPNLSALTTHTAVTVNNLRFQYDGLTCTFSCQLNVGTALVSSAGQQITGLPVVAAINGCDVNIVNVTTNAAIGGAFVTGSGITLPAINVGSSVTLLISGRYFAA